MSDNQQTTISLIRHGQVYNPGRVIYGRLPGFGLSNMGKRQVESTAEYLRLTNLAVIYSSPLLRARETADIIQQFHKDQSVMIADPINEVRFQFEGQPMDNMADRNWDLYTGTSDEFEKPGDIINRVQPFLYSLRHKYSGQQLALITHGDVIAFTLLWVYNRELLPQNKHTLDTLGINDDYPAPASITNLIYSLGDPSATPQLEYIKPYDASLEDQGVSPR